MEEKNPNKRSLIGLLKERLALPGEDLKTYQEQYKKLTDKDKQDFVKWFAEEGIEATIAQSK